MNTSKIEIDIDGKKIILETGKIAKQANGAAVLSMGDTMLLATACASDEPREGFDFFPLTVEYREKLYAGGKIPGSFFRREGRPGEKETLACRLIDRPIRPLFPKDYRNEVQIFATVISADPEVESDVHGITATSVALCLSDIPFAGPIAGVRVGRCNGKLVAYPTPAEMEESEMDMVVAGSESSILMVEGGAYEMNEDDMLEGIEFAHEKIKTIVAAQKQLVEQAGKPKRSVEEATEDTALRDRVEALGLEDVKKSMEIAGKHERSDFLKASSRRIREEICGGIEDENERKDQEKAAKGWYEKMAKREMRAAILNTGIRIGSRKTTEVRPITCEVSLLPRAHGSALFTRGETQALVTATLGTKLDEQKIENVHGESSKSYMLHYNFPPYCTGETKMMRGTSRREIGHGNLAERSLAPVLPVVDAFPYTIRVVSDIMESNGSSSMATVCGGSLSLMDAGVPIKSSVAGVAMGLIKEGEQVAILTDILGDEDHLGDMDFKVAGTREGITAFQMDIKIDGISSEIMRQALAQAREGRLHILGEMDKEIGSARQKLSDFAPRIFTVKISVEKIGAIIGPGGKVIRGIQDETGATLNVDDDGTILIYAEDGKGGEAAKAMVEEITAEAEIGKVYTGRVKNITNFGAFVEFMPGKEGLLHISEIEHHRVNRVEDVLNSGDEVTVKLISEESDGKYRLSRKVLLAKA